ncbi:alpha/beta hydrolase family protein [Reyranella sp.]|uniref:alpha/beta hydrolase family protein n=1 Tax=Reyranella sp. TaxID=1929291 RepID=UPI003BA9973A
MGREEQLEGDLQGTLIVPSSRTGLGVVVLHGSGGRPDVERAHLFARHGAVALAPRWFGGEGQVPGICEVPLEDFVAVVDYMKGRGCERIALAGTSKGAEAALLVAAQDPRVDAVIAVSPSSVVWANTGPGRDGEAWPQRSSWTLGGTALPFVAYDPYWRPQKRDGLVAYRSFHEDSLRRFAREALAATIPVDRIEGEVLLVAGGDDALWPSDMFARAISARRSEASKATTLLIDPDAGHRVLLPGETKARSSLHAHGGNDEADRRLGAAAWAAIVAALRLD